MKKKSYPKLKMNKDELQAYLLFKRRGSIVEAKKGKGTRYKRSRDSRFSTEDTL
jgi:hypothetical protein